LAKIPGITLYGGPDLDLRRDRVGIVPFNLRGVEHAAVADALALDHGISVRSGCFCAQPLVARLLGRPALTSAHSAALAARLLTDRESRLGAPGMVRASFGLCTSEADIDDLCRAVAEIAKHPQPSRARDERLRQRKLDVQRKVADVFAS
jgi:selenocysteine lyase/cysteine desulfurase